MPSGTLIKKFATCLLLALLLCGCATTYVPISWDFRDKVLELSRSDLTLAILFNRYDPTRSTLRGGGQSFNEVMMPSQVKFHLGAYRPDTQLIYRNLYQNYNDRELRDLMVHEFSHHIWFNFMSQQQRSDWQEHLEHYPSPLQAMVRNVYPRPSDYDTEDFAFTVEYARPVDIEALAGLNLISAQECAALLSEREKKPSPASPHGSAQIPHAGPSLSQNAPKSPEKETTSLP